MALRGTAIVGRKGSNIFCTRGTNMKYAHCKNVTSLNAYLAM